MSTLRCLLVLLVLLASCSRKEQGLEELKTPELKLTITEHKLENQGLQIKVNFEVTEGWHIYGPKPQKNGRPSSVVFFAKGEEKEADSWPATKVFNEGESGPSDAYDGSFSVATIFPQQMLPLKQIKAKIRWVACKDICVPGEAELIHIVN